MSLRTAIPVCLTLGLLLVAAEVGSRELQAPATPYIEKSTRAFQFYPGGKITLAAGLPGNFEIRGWDRASVELETEKILYHLPVEEARKIAPKLPVSLRYNQTSATISTSGILPHGALAEIHGILRVPQAKTDINIRMIKGDLVLENINGWMEATLEEGSLEARSLQGYVSFITRLGDVLAEMSHRRWSGQGFTAGTLRGSIHLRLPATYSAALQLETRDGSIRIDFPEQMVDGERVPLEVVTRKNARTLTATVGEGGAPIRLHTTIGDVQLTTSDQRRE